MKDLVPPPPGIVRNELQRVQQLFQRHVVPSYARFDLAFTHGTGSYLYDVNGRRYLDFGGGIAVCCLGHAHPAVTEALVEQSRRMVHVSNLYYHERQGRLAERLSGHLAPGKVFFANSGGEANEGLYKLARRFGHDEGRFEILTALNSFHGRTLAGIAATGQEKVRKRFGPVVPGFRQIPFNDLDAARQALSPATVAILIEGVQGEGGITPATPEYLLGLRQLCDERRLLLLMDGVQCGHFRTGRFQSFQRIIEGVPGEDVFLPDGLSMAKSLGNGFPIGAFWVRAPHADLLDAGSHATTYGGTPLGCAVALAVLDVIEKEKLPDNARSMGTYLRLGLEQIATRHPGVLRGVRGLGLMLGIEFAPQDQLPALAAIQRTVAAEVVNRLHQAGLLTVPAGAQVIRFLPALNLTRTEADQGLELFETVVRGLSG